MEHTKVEGAKGKRSAGWSKEGMDRYYTIMREIVKQRSDVQRCSGLECRLLVKLQDKFKKKSDRKRKRTGDSIMVALRAVETVHYDSDNNVIPV